MTQKSPSRLSEAVSVRTRRRSPGARPGRPATAQTGKDFKRHIWGVLVRYRHPRKTKKNQRVEKGSDLVLLCKRTFFCSRCRRCDFRRRICPSRAGGERSSWVRMVSEREARHDESNCQGHRCGGQRTAAAAVRSTRLAVWKRRRWGRARGSGRADVGGGPSTGFRGSGRAARGVAAGDVGSVVRWRDRPRVREGAERHAVGSQPPQRSRAHPALA